MFFTYARFDLEKKSGVMPKKKAAPPTIAQELKKQLKTKQVQLKQALRKNIRDLRSIGVKIRNYPNKAAVRMIRAVAQ